MLKIKHGFQGEQSILLPMMIREFLARDPFCCSLHLTQLGYYTHAQHHYIDRTTPINEWVYIYCVDGCGWYRYAGAQHSIEAGQYFILPANEPHSYGASEDDPWTIYWMHLNGNLAPIYTAGKHLPQQMPLSEKLQHHVLTQMFEEILSILNDGCDIENLRYANAILYHYLGFIFFKRQSLNNDSLAMHSPVDACQHAIHYMKEHVEQRLSLKQLAKFTGYTPNHFVTLFKRTIGYAPLTYFTLMKMQLAAQMLRTTNLKANQVAAKLGYDDPAYFTRVFTKTMGSSPIAYRNVGHN